MSGMKGADSMGVSKVLIVDDESAVRTALSRALELEGYDADVSPSGERALEALTERPYDLVLLDVTMPGIDGLGVCERLRARGDGTPIIIVTARGRTEDAVAGLDAGADDYLVKPFPLDELLARMRALLRRTGGAKHAQMLRVADLELDPTTLTARRGERSFPVTRIEFAMLHLFMRNPGRVLTKHDIQTEVWGADLSATSNAHEIYVGYLRKKMEYGGDARLLHTVRGEGYVLRAPDED